MPDSLTLSRHAAVVADLARDEPGFATIVDAFGPPAFWTRPPGFATLVLVILEQQVSLASAAAAYARLELRVGTVTPSSVFESTDEELRADGFSRQKAGYVRSLADAVLDGRLDLGALHSATDDTARRILVDQKGIGPWSADVYLLSCLRRPDIWPIGDRALQVAAQETFSLPTVPRPDELEDLGSRWRPHRSTAARLLWHGYLARRGRAVSDAT